MPIQCEYYALEGLSQLLSTIKLVQKNLNPGLQMEGILLTMYDNRTNLSNQVVADVQENFKEKVFKTIIPRNVRLSEAPSFGQSIIGLRCKIKRRRDLSGAGTGGNEAWLRQKADWAAGWVLCARI